MPSNHPNMLLSIELPSTQAALNAFDNGQITLLSCKKRDGFGFDRKKLWVYLRARADAAERDAEDLFKVIRQGHEEVSCYEDDCYEG